MSRFHDLAGAIFLNKTRELTTHDVAEIERAAADIEIEGERYPEHLMKTVGR